MAAAIQQRQHCGEVFITNNYLMMVECKFCCEQFTAYDKFLNHIFNQHFDDVDKFNGNVDESTEYDDENILNTLDTGEYDMKFIGMLTGCNEALKTNDINESKHSAEVSLPEDKEKLDGSYVSTEITLCPSKINNKNGTSQTKGNTHPMKNPGKDPISSKYRPVAIKYRTFPEGEDRKFKCRICGYAFAQMHILRSHEKRHSTSKPFPCTKCNKRFFTRTELDTHIRWHTGERPFVCTYCGSGFITNGALNIHEKRHQDKRNYKCDECGKRFFDGYQLRTHAVVHTRERNYKCEQCEATFTRVKSLRNHMKLHENALRASML
ncbi:PREDICTED: zinc finger protein 62-like isoform X2 [Rhagoletis zephyria]|uniref:zinc finger protein 62-like isoform X2 n=1 Tax=Rhagoletis zephyria TaxID=28612 RepID=UPI0008114712|nr:PREDICTED: zinc finger protein 62-like isoform X2 [Rhagoletis zephyria]